jgi:hypothetical protein
MNLSEVMRNIAANTRKIQEMDKVVAGSIQ